jgi:uncharacterized protein (TIGR00369 family)
MTQNSQLNFNQQANTLNGMDRIRFFEQQTTRHGMAENLGYSLQHFSEGTVQLRYCTQARHQNLIGSLHGGITASLLDAAMGLAVTTHLQIGEGHTMTDLNTKFIRPVFNDEWLTIDAWIMHAGKRMFTAGSNITNEQGKLVASALASAIRL